MFERLRVEWFGISILNKHLNLNQCYALVSLCMDTVTGDKTLRFQAFVNLLIHW